MVVLSSKYLWSRSSQSEGTCQCWPTREERIQHSPKGYGMVGVVSSACRKHATKCCCKAIVVRGSSSSSSLASVASRFPHGERQNKLIGVQQAAGCTQLHTMTQIESRELPDNWPGESLDDDMMILRTFYLPWLKQARKWWHDAIIPDMMISSLSIIVR